MPCELDPKVPKTTDTLNSDQIAALQTSLAKSVVGRNTRTDERSSLYRSELVRNGSNAACFSDDHFCISSVHRYSRRHRIVTIDYVSASAWFAHSIFAAEEADTDSLTDFPPGHACPQRFNATNHFMPRNARQSQTRVGARDRGHIGVTDSACFHPNPNLTCSRLRNWPFHQAKNARG
jgi:hypothetical protein